MMGATPDFEAHEAESRALLEEQQRARALQARVLIAGVLFGLVLVAAIVAWAAGR